MDTPALLGFVFLVHTTDWTIKNEVRIPPQVQEIQLLLPRHILHSTDPQELAPGRDHGIEDDHVLGQQHVVVQGRHQAAALGLGGQGAQRGAAADFDGSLRGLHPLVRCHDPTNAVFGDHLCSSVVLDQLPRPHSKAHTEIRARKPDSKLLKPLRLPPRGVLQKLALQRPLPLVRDGLPLPVPLLALPLEHLVLLRGHLVQRPRLLPPVCRGVGEPEGAHEPPELLVLFEGDAAVPVPVEGQNDFVGLVGLALWAEQ
mmetsp:Transcript_72930/g.194637  ORF Transcript_72930/g.194637 Transcript_72930/m.194637 type:complete len:257 (-) Transcript_72930:428-1198(-)